MIAIIAEKPSVGQDIVRVVGAARKKEGYREGNGYAVTWALGHLISLAMPEAYGHTGDGKQELPVVPDDFRLAVRQVRTDRGDDHRPGCRQAAENHRKSVRQV